LQFDFLDRENAGGIDEGHIAHAQDEGGLCESRTLPDTDMRVDLLSANPPVTNDRGATSRAAVGPSSAAMEGK
jgi:hypothetical protein